MPKYQDVKKVLVIGSGPIVIGQAAEFDYAGTQACRALQEEGIEVVLINSNPATIMTDKMMADKIYVEPLVAESVRKVIEIEKPDSILPTLGGQTGLNLAMELAEEGYLDKMNVRLLGTATSAIKMAEDRQAFKDTMESIGEPCIASLVVETCEDAVSFANEIGYPVIVRPAYTLGGTGGGIANNEQELQEIASNGLRLSRVHQVLIEKCISGWKEIEFEVIRDGKGNAITVCSMENIDPVGVHTGDSVVIAPAQTLSDKEYQMLRKASLNIIHALDIEGGCNCQFALHPDSFEYAVIEVNPRLSRSSALASKATGYPIAKVASKIAIGYGLDEIVNAVTGKTCACFEPAIDYCVIKFPKWPFDKFVKAKRTLGTQMKATGEVMAISDNIEGALMKAVRCLELGVISYDLKKLKALSKKDIVRRLSLVDDERFFVICEAFRRDVDIDMIHTITTIDLFFLHKLKNIVDMELRLEKEELTPELLAEAKKMSFPDKLIASLSGISEIGVRAMRELHSIFPVYKMVDTCAAEFEAVTPYYYSTYDSYTETVSSAKKKIVVIGSGPIRIGQGIEFDYCSVHAVWALKEAGYETIIINNNPETVSTDFDTADKLYFEPLTAEDVGNILEIEQPDGVLVQFGGQTAIKLTQALKDMGVRILGTKAEDIDAAEDREVFDDILEACKIRRPEGRTVFTHQEALEAANELGYPVLVRPSYVLGGQGMEIAYNDQDVQEFMDIITMIRQEHPILIDKYMMGKEIEVDAICDGTDILIPGIMEHLERAGVHSGDSISIYPAPTLTQKIRDDLVNYTEKLAKALHVVGLVNIQFVLYEDEIYVIEVNPRSSRTVPYISKVTNVPMVDLATRCVLGEKLKDMGCGTGLHPEGNHVAVKVPVFSFEKLHDVDISLGPEMKSTGEVLGISTDFSEALYKGLLGAGFKMSETGNVLITVRDTDKEEILDIARGFRELGYQIYSTAGTAEFLMKNGVVSATVSKIGEGSPDILDLLQEGRFNMVINTATKGRRPERDGFKIRRKTVELSIPCLTSLDTAKAFLAGLQSSCKKNDLTMVNLIEV
ncbi:MAG: carbamoyl-phosphate synthase large subunit [Ruminococcaceae bacterium]|nr:carbamoyl-phosphate synthase large subunit [Oscillospiraceae bacterium]